MIQSLQQAEQPGNGTIEVQRENVERLPGEGPARVNPNTMIRHGAGGSGGSQGGTQASSGGQSAGTSALPDSPEGAQEEIDRLVAQEQQAAEAGVSSDSLASIQDRIGRLKQHRDSLRGGAPRPAPARPDTSDGVMGLRRRAQGDTTRADTTRSLRSTPTSSTDTTAAADTTRGVGRSPGHVSPQELGMKTSGGNPGGGGGAPSSGGARLRDLGGQPRSTEKLTEEATSLVMEQGPDVVRRRLDSLLEKGRIDRSTRDSVHARALGELMRVQREMGQ